MSSVFVEFPLGFRIVSATFQDILFGKGEQLRVAHTAHIGRPSISTIDIQYADFTEKVTGTQPSENIVLLTRASRREGHESE